MADRYWLVKSEPDEFSIDDLARDGVAPWEGVRNYQARNLMRDHMQVGDDVLFYHSSTTPPGVVGLARVARTAYPDPTQFDPDSHYYDPTSKPDDPRWVMVDVAFVDRLGLVPLDTLKRTPGLEDMVVTRRGMRLSVQPVTAREWEIVVALGRAAAASPPEAADATTPAAARPRKKTAARPKSAAKPKAAAKKTAAKPKTAAKSKTAAAKKTAAKSKTAAAKKTAAKPKTAAKKTSAAKKKTAARPSKPTAG